MKIEKKYFILFQTILTALGMSDLCIKKSFKYYNMKKNGDEKQICVPEDLNF